ncbi:DUF307-domain-containing protein [Rozella allomycis CSF55]|uniref:DUF307-domain-containing protein n=1 Tax=Rozella allomycis (strain CSF55) TaxID=988480 RepID=A0A075AQD0_ROZAC|nr:hypothetical protein O9G_002802 [Rozella allomycis CSF55]RKP18190.1 DUF307-domain-containing protein [Rozella allomycis CSF55]|eukprot:EPZ30925.1 hypothetical protein O9G_002802 [Rozella allomycis CSF55]
MHPYTIVANVIWLIVIGIPIALMHAVTAMIQFITIIGIGTAIQNLRLSLFALWPFGKKIRNAHLPTKYEQLPRFRAEHIRTAPMASYEYA